MTLLERFAYSGVPAIPIKGDRCEKFGDESDIRSQLQLQIGYNRNCIITESNTHLLVRLKNPKPHNPRGGDVLWFTEKPKKKDGQIPIWTTESWKKLAKDEVFLQDVQKKALELVIQANDSAFMFKGYADEEAQEKAKESKIMHPSGLQSINRPHIHIGNQPFPEISEIGFINFLEMNNLKGLKPDKIDQMFFFYNLAGQAAQEHFKESLSNFGAGFQYPTPLFKYPNIESGSLNNQFYGFGSFSEALNKTLELERKVKNNWETFCLSLREQTEKNFSVEHGNRNSAIKDLEIVLRYYQQSVIPNFVFVFPSQKERTRLANPNSFPVWVCPFSTANARNLLNGVILQRK